MTTHVLIRTPLLPEEKPAPAGRQPVPRKTDRREHPPTVRAQAIQMRVDGRSWTDIEAVIGAGRRTVQHWLKKAKELGWEPGQPILESHVTNVPRPGRPVLARKGSEEAASQDD